MNNAWASLRGQRPPAKQRILHAVEVITRGEERGKDRRLKDRSTEELIRAEDPGCGQSRRHSDGKHRHRAIQPCDAVTTGRGRYRNAHGHRGRPPPAHDGHPAPRQTAQWRAIIRQDRSPQRPGEHGADVVWRRAASLGRAMYHGHSQLVKPRNPYTNSIISSRGRRLRWIFPLISAIFYASKRIPPPSSCKTKAVPYE